MKHGSLFSGIGGFDLAAEWRGWENMFHCEWNEFGQKVLNYYWPNAECFGDITKSDFKKYNGTIDIISGGFPCQPFSAAGKRKGNKDDRHLWPEMLRAIKEIQPRWVVGENVLGLLNWSKGLVFHEVQTDLEAAGYVIFPYVLPACSRNAPHLRNRTWIIAYSNSYGNNSTNRCNGGLWESKSEVETRNGWPSQTNRLSYEQLIADTNYRSRPFNPIQTRRKKSKELHDFSRNDSNTKCKGLERRGRQWEGLEQGLQINDWTNWPTQPPICSRNDGIPSKLVGITFPKHRTESIKGYGNAIVPQVAYEIFKAIEQYESNNI